MKTLNMHEIWKKKTQHKQTKTTRLFSSTQKSKLKNPRDGSIAKGCSVLFCFFIYLFYKTWLRKLQSAFY